MNTNTLNILARREALTLEDWIELLKARREVLKTHLRDMSLGSLGDLKLISDSKGQHKISESGQFHRESPYYKERYIYPDLLELSTYWCHRGEVKTIPSTSSNSLTQTELLYKFWALSRDGKWVLQEVCIDEFSDHPKGATVLKTTQTVKKISGRYLHVDQLIHELGGETAAYKIWSRLSNYVHTWASQRLEILRRAQAIASIMDQEDSLINHLRNAST